MDVVYLVRTGEMNNELRMSLRSLVNLDHDRVWFVGHKPRWIEGIGHIPGNRHGRAKPMNVFDNIRLACEHPDISEQFVVMNDDFFVLQPNPHLGPWIRCSLDHHADVMLKGRKDSWAKSVRHTRDWLRSQAIENPMSYEFHYPVVLDKSGMLDAIERVGRYGHPDPPQWRSLYGNLYVGATEPVEDCKVNRSHDLDAAMARPMISTTDGSFPVVRSRLKELFPDPSRYEVV
jgi:hypothetical protein